MIRDHSAPWLIPFVSSSVLHLGLGWIVLGLSLTWVPTAPAVLPVHLEVLEPEPSKVQPPPARPPLPPPRRAPVITPVTPPPIVAPEPPRPLESTADSRPPVTVADAMRSPASPPPAPEVREPARPTPAPTVEPSSGVVIERRAATNGETRVPAPALPSAPAGDPRPGIAAPPAAEPAVAATGPRTASITPAPALGSGVTQTARPRGGYQVVPTYPATARRLGAQGTTLLRVLVQDDGRVGDVQIQRSAGHPDLDRAAEEAVRRWRFDPARKGTQAVAIWVLLPVEFHLSD